MIDRLMNIDRRIIFIFVFLGVAGPLLVQFNFPIKPTSNVRAVYDQIEEVAAKEGTVLLSFSYGPSTVPELQPMARAVLRHCFAKGVKVVAICLWPDGVGLAQQALDKIAAEFGRQYGEDYAFLGYKPGFSIVVVNMGHDIHSAFPQDTKGTPLAELSVTRDLRSLRDVDFVFDLAAGSSIDAIWIPYGQEKYKFPLAAGCTAVIAPDLFPYLQSGQLVGLVGGLAGAAEYEALVETPEAATLGMSPQSMTHVILIAFIALGNLMYFLSRRAEARA